MNIDKVAADPVDRSRYPADPWRLVEVDHDLAGLGAAETLFAVGNGYLGFRGNPEEGRDAFAHGTFINGFHETWTIHHAENAFGFARTGQTIVDVPDSKLMKLYVDDEPLLLSVADLEHYERSLDFAEGVLRRSLVWRTPAGKRVRVESTRMVSFTDRHLALMTLEVTMLDGSAPVVVSSQILNRQAGVDEYHRPDMDAEGAEFDPRKAAAFAHRVLVPQGDWHSERRMLLGYRTAISGMTLAVGADHAIDTTNPYEELTSTDPDVGKKVYRVEARPGEPIRVLKAVAYHSSRHVPTRELFDRCRRTLDRVRDHGFAHYHAKQRAWLETFWANSDVEVPGQPAVQQAVRWSLFQLAQATARADLLGIAAMGVTGSGYEGHYFWDTEIYLVPFLTFTNPWLAHNALRFRVNILPHARARARELNQRGVLFPWRTINGEEASAYYAAGTAQYHIDADVAYSLCKYVDVSGDKAFMLADGAEVLAETARMFADLGFWRETDEGRRFEIHGVTGPDEYTAVVDNNLFTNVMARANLRRAAEVIADLRAEHPTEYARLERRIGLDAAEIDEWRACAEGMYIPFDERLGIHPQDGHFLEREVWDLPNTPRTMRPLLLHFHPLVIYRFQVLKQADIVLALFLQGDQFTVAEKRADFDYYAPITTGDSTLSAVVQSIMAAEVGYQDLAMDYFHAGLYVDLADLHANTSDGVHIASAGGVWNALVYGFGGLRDHGGDITFDPRLPAGWDGLVFHLRVRGTRVRVDLRPTELVLTAEEGEGVEVGVRGVRYQVGAEPVTVALADQGPVRRPGTPEEGVRPDGSPLVPTIPTVVPSLPTIVVDEGPR